MKEFKFDGDVNLALLDEFVLGEENNGDKAVAVDEARIESDFLARVFKEDSDDNMALSKKYDPETPAEDSYQDIGIYFRLVNSKKSDVLCADDEFALTTRIVKHREDIFNLCKDFPLTNRIGEEYDKEDGRGGETKEIKALAEISRLIFKELKRINSIDSKAIKRKTIRKETKLSKSKFEKVFYLVSEKALEVKKMEDAMLLFNTRLVVIIAKRFVDRGVAVRDLIQEGNLGLIKAIDRFDPMKRYKFCTYATWWIKQRIVRCLIEQGKTIRLPVYLFELYSKIQVASSQFIQEFGREPFDEEVAKLISVPIETVQSLFNSLKQVLSLNHTGEDYGGTDNRELIETIADCNVVPSDIVAIERDLARKMKKLLIATLSKKEREVIERRFGIGYDRDYTLEEVGRHFEITRERVRQIEAKALKKLKHPLALKKLTKLK